jgi:hypothetical protein
MKTLLDLLILAGIAGLAYAALIVTSYTQKEQLYCKIVASDNMLSQLGCYLAFEAEHPAKVSWWNTH